MYNPDKHHRRSIRLKEYDYSRAGLYYITICVQNRYCLFGEINDGIMILNDTGKIINEEWQNLPKKYSCIKLHEYIVMPNHFHAIVEIVANTVNTVGAGSACPLTMAKQGRAIEAKGQADPAPTTMSPIPIGNIIGYFKYQTTKKINSPDKFWQRNYYEHIIRNEQSYQKIAQYIINNPKNWEEDNFFHLKPESE